MDPVERYCQEEDVTVADDLSLYVVASDADRRTRYTAGLYEGDIDALDTDTSWDDTPDVELRNDVSGDGLYDVAVQVVKHMRLRYEGDTLPAVNFTPSPYLDTYRPLKEKEKERFAADIDAAMDQLPPL